MNLPPLKFADLADRLLDMADKLLPLWLPGGEILKKHYSCSDLGGGEGGSMTVWLKDGSWHDFATGEGGRDLISLYAASKGLGMAQAAMELAEDYNLQDVLGVVKTGFAGKEGKDKKPPQVEEPKEEAEPPKKSKRDDEPVWEVIAPVPENTPKPFKFRHWKFGEPSTVWAYVLDGHLYGYVCRYDRINSSGKPVKEILPLTWCKGADGKTFKWHNIQWNLPRPLYVARGSFTDNAVVLVEGEKCADAGHKAFADAYDFISWPGGANAHDKAIWEWLRGKEVVLWPDYDLKRFPLSAAERKSGVDPKIKDVKPYQMQPGYKAMVQIGSKLVADYGCTVRMVDVLKLAKKLERQGCELPDGWDIADALAGVDGTVDGAVLGIEPMMPSDVQRLIENAPAFVPPDEGTRSKAGANGNNNGNAKPPNEGAGAGGDYDDEAWRGCLVTTATGSVRPVRENVVLALDGLPDKGIAGVSEAKEVIAFNQFTNDVMKLKTTPWGTDSGVWSEVDELRLGEWLVFKYRLPSMPRTALEEAVAVVADRYKFHPVREYLSSLKWDGTRRLHTWLRKACRDEDEPVDDAGVLDKYLARAGTWFLQGMVARVMEPGCKFDYMLILEGKQGKAKSGLFKVLAGDWFADTGLNLGDKDSLQQLQGRWLYEFAELDAFGKADVTKIKQYTASSSDYFRASYARRAQEYPRQIVFGGTTNERHYLTDPTGNRRFWPVGVTRESVNIEWLTENRNQLFAEALERWKAGKKMYPSYQEQSELFEPQQNDRMIDNAIESTIIRYLYPPENDLSERASQGRQEDGLSLVDLLTRIGISVERLQAGRFHEKQAAAALRKLEWVEKRSSSPGRPRLYWRPEDDAKRIREMNGEKSTQDNNGEADENDYPY